MRRRRAKRLEVSTFPFLAVLLCTMGSLLLVMLVMDRKAKLAKLQQAELALTQSEDAKAAQEQEHADRLAARGEEQERLDREAKEKWEGKRTAIHTRLTEEQRHLQARLEAQRQELLAAAARLQAEEAGAKSRVGELTTARDTLAGLRQSVAQLTAQSSQTQSVAEEGNKRIAEMTRRLQELEAALALLKAAREQQKKTVSVVPYFGKQGTNLRPLYVECSAAGLIFHPDKKTVAAELPGPLRAEFEQRFAWHKQGQPESQPYVLFLIRPNGIEGYYAAKEALPRSDCQFGYEMVDADWALEAPADALPPPNQQLVTNPRIGTGGGPGTGASGHGGSGTGTARRPPAGAGGAGEPGPGPLGTPGGTGNAVGEAITRAPGAGGNLPLPGGSTQPDHIGSGSPGTPAAPAPPGANTTGNEGSPQAPNTPVVTNPTPASNPGGATPRPKAGPAAPGPNSGGTGNPNGGNPGGGKDADRVNPADIVGLERQVPVRPAMIGGAREFTLFLECKADRVVVHPSGQEFALAQLTRAPGGNPLLTHAVDQLQRQQPRADAPPVRLQVRFLVHADGLRTYHLAFPCLEGLRVPTTAQPLRPEDKVAEIVAGN